MDTAVADTTPVTTPETPAVAPTTSAPSAESTTSQRPTSFAQAFEQVAAREAETTEPTETAATAPSVEQPPTSAEHPSTDTKQGPIPFTVHKTALENARTKGAEEAVAKYRQQYGWAESVPRETVQEFSQIASRMTNDPIGFLTDFVKELESHPVHSQALRSQAGRILSSGRQAVDLSPDVQITDANGQIVGSTFSAERVQAIVAKAVQDAIGKEVAPLKSAHQQQQAAQKAAETRQQVEAATDAAMQEVHDILEITDAKADGSLKLFSAVNEVMAQNPSWSAEKAAREVWKTHVRPTYERKATEKVLDTNNKKAAAATANGRGTTATPKRPGNAAELAAYMRSLEK